MSSQAITGDNIPLVKGMRVWIFEPADPAFNCKEVLCTGIVSDVLPIDLGVCVQVDSGGTYCPPHCNCYSTEQAALSVKGKNSP